MTAAVPPCQVAPSGGQHVIAAGGYQATLVEVGGGIRDLRHRGRAILDGYEITEMCDGARGQMLIPWPNRLDHGRYRFGGQEYQLAITEPEKDCAIHGLVRWANWTANGVAADSVTLRHRLHSQPGWPHIIDLAVDYRVGVDGLTVTVSATNVGDAPAPYGNGAHPYLTARTAHIDDCRLHLPADVRLVNDQRGIPTGTEKVGGTEYDFRAPRHLGATKIDSAFTGLHRDSQGRAWTSLSGPDGYQVSLWMDETYRWIEVFTGDHLPRPDKRRAGLGVEPMSCPPNAYATGEGVVTLEPGATAVGQWGLMVQTSSECHPDHS